MVALFHLACTAHSQTKYSGRPYDSFPPIIAPRAPSCVRKRRFPCLKMNVQIRGYHSQMAHRRQIAQWVGTRTTHPGGTGFEPWRGRFHQTRRRVANKVGGIQEDHPGGVASPGSRPVLAQNQGVSPRASRRGFFLPPKTRPWVFRWPKIPILLKT